MIFNLPSHEHGIHLHLISSPFKTSNNLYNFSMKVLLIFAIYIFSLVVYVSRFFCKCLYWEEEVDNFQRRQSCHLQKKSLFSTFSIIIIIFLILFH